MSVYATTWVWQNSESAGNARLVLLAIADAADAEGSNAWPSQQRIANMTRLSVRTVRRLVDNLVTLGELEVAEHGGPAYRADRVPHRYRLAKMPSSTGGHPDPPSPRSARHGRTAATPRADKPAPRADTAVSGKRPLRTSFQEQKNPSGGSVPEPAPPSMEVEPMPKTPAQDTALALDFGSTPVHRARKNGKTSATKGAQTVVAAYVTAYREHHEGTDPARSQVGRVARDASQLIINGKAKPEELETAATAMGATPYANLPVQLSMLRQRGGPTASKGIAPVAPAGSFTDAAERSHREFLDKIKNDRSVAAWVADDPAAVAALIAEDPALEAVFAAVSAA